MFTTTRDRLTRKRIMPLFRSAHRRIAQADIAKRAHRSWPRGLGHHYRRVGLLARCENPPGRVGTSVMRVGEFAALDAQGIDKLAAAINQRRPSR
ncbi:hypothetical protein [Rhizobium leguminosarum]|uniref:hypothetical protein n=1 Tax=Rhizobium leguminosarum TaxID=384 RepID=UPI00103F4ACC|nr:hypothetical protein [Rhizobium leguminosarum]TBZ68897.1 hypothetical protein E0H43_24005 [Rhizobium leguminosarum bv. viciae]